MSPKNWHHILLEKDDLRLFFHFDLGAPIPLLFQNKREQKRKRKIMLKAGESQL